ncbi:TPA: hNH endonuclease [Citrobacter braakii]|nr:hNH endonuclease [Citrobacter braakii]
MKLFEMEGFLRGKCIPRDLKVNETNAEYLVRKFSELQSQNADMAVQLANAESKCRELAAENGGLKAICDDRRMFIMNGVQLGYIQVPTVETDPALETIRVAVSPQEPTPAADAFLAEVRAQGVDMAACALDDVNQFNYANMIDDLAQKLRQEAAQ